MADTTATPIAQRVRRFWRRQDPPPAAPSEAAEERRIATLEARLEYLETQFEGLQDAVYRQDLAHRERLAALTKRTEAAEIARELSEDARKRGL